MKLVVTGDAQIAVHRWGERGDVPVVFWHALGPDASGAKLAGVAAVLADAGFHVVALDGPGFGKSPLLPPERYRLASLVAILHELIDRLDLDRPVVMGHSWGGSVAVRYAAAHPEDVRALVLLDSGHLDYCDLPDVDAERPVEEWIAEVEARRDPRRAQARGRAMKGLTADTAAGGPSRRQTSCQKCNKQSTGKSAICL
ncbi:MAG: 4,5:9,10-diseco-3-hydroxy-5,9,17-trioxoandrosta(10),2-diene-4-oate hydrolase [Gaiellaceae bacterium]|jgi:pimeloyl-ACP methyl ester carboxylesterase|nr:4,5:9,10-diseco-3-hydroxy-5,9,17-trioxoandrosta(10),2-diene-4-oate hydrolase [Gaiellaceae bacterium]